MSSWLGIAGWALVLLPLYLWVSAAAISSAYFRAKLRYHRDLFSRLEPRGE
jgi:hypothetical protein